MSLLLQPPEKQQHKARSKIASFRLPVANFFILCSFVDFFNKPAIGNWKSAILFVRLIDYSTFVMFAGERFTGDSIFTFNPPAEIDELAALRTEGTKRIVFPLDRPTAGWAIHVL